MAKLTNLESLELHDTQVSDVSPLAKLTKLKSLYVVNTQVSDEAIDQLKRALPEAV